MSIKSIDISRLRNPLFLQFIKDVLGIVFPNDIALLSVTDQYNLLQAIANALQILFKPELTNPITEELLAIDLRRDNAINGVIANTQSFTYHFDSNNKAAAKILVDYFGIYGTGIAKESYPSETAIITNIVIDLNGKANLSASVAILGLVDWVTEMDSANQEFNKKYLARTQDIAAASGDTMKAKRLEALNAYYSLRDNLNAYFIIKKGAEPFATTISQLNSLIDQYNKLLTGRSGSGDTPTEPPTVPPVV